MNSSRHLDDLGDSITVAIPADEDGYTGRECPNEDCLGYFKVTFGTGPAGATECVCPYCGTTEDHDHFWTQDQIRYAQSVAERELLEAVHKDLKAMEFEVKPPRNSMFGIGMSLKVDPLRLPHLYRYAEKNLETEVVCDRCTLRYAIYGVFGYCPDCGTHNSTAILDGNLSLIEKMLVLADAQDDAAVSEKLVENALEDCVSAFDGWGRATVAAFASEAADPEKASKVSFQDLVRARGRVMSLFGYDLSQGTSADEFDATHTLFHKRHLVAHKLGVVDQDYIDNTGDDSVPVGRKVRFDSADIRSAITVLRRISAQFSSRLEGAHERGS